MLRKSVGEDVLDIKAGLETWFDETMARLEGAYKRWATVVLFFVGLALAGGLNASTVDVAHKLWQDPVTREGVVAAAGKLTLPTPTPSATPSSSPLSTVADNYDTLAQLHLPIGWSHPTWEAFYMPWWHVPMALLGYLVTAFLLMLGGPFWFDLLSRLVNLRGAGPKPPTAAEDVTSASSQKMARST